jgi:effector-binding domain-containing protein
MLSPPEQQWRDRQPYAAIAARLPMSKMATVLPEAWPAVNSWLSQRRLSPAGAPFIRYRVIDMAGYLQIEVGIPITEATPSDGRIVCGTMPAGHYVTAIYTGHYDGLVGANAALQAWGADNGVEWHVTDSEDGTVWGNRVEFYLTDPSQEPNPERWRTEITYLLAAGTHGRSGLG